MQEQLRRNVQAPTEEQLEFIKFLLARTGSGKSVSVDSYVQAEAIIEKLLEVREKQFQAECERTPPRPSALTVWMRQNDDIVANATMIGLFGAGLLLPILGAISLLLGLGALALALPIQRSSGGQDGAMLMLFAIGALLMGFGSLLRIILFSQ